MKNLRRSLALLLCAYIMACSMLAPTVFAVEAGGCETVASAIDPLSFRTEIRPMMTNSCKSNIIYTNSSIPKYGNVPNAYYYTAGGSSTGKVFSVAQMNSAGQTIWRRGAALYNGMLLKHGNILGLHQHDYTWHSPIDYLEKIFGLS